jgi:uncharacterized protein YutE (UPF0331/DUF86 family)
VNIRKNVKRAAASQAEKAITFARAHETLKALQQKGDYLSAYVLAFSIIEDRVRAMFVVRFKHEHAKDPSANKIQQSLTEIIRYLAKRTDIPQEIATSLISAIRARNELIHAALWHLNITTAKDVEEVIRWGRIADTLRRKQKQKIKA